jgi:aspartate aminotransferase-like enzyme
METNFRIPGPTPLPPEVMAAMQRPMISHRGPEFKELYLDTLRMAREAHRTEHPVLLWPASGSAGWEASIVNLLAPGDPVLATVCGEFGERYAKVAVAFGLDVRRLDVPWGKAVTPAALREALEANPEVKAVFITHNETATAVTNPVRELAAVVRDHGALVLVDAVSGAGALPLEVDAWGLDFVMSGSQKAWMCPPGLMIAAIGPRAWDAAARPGFPRFYWDFAAALKQAENGFTPTTPALSTLYAFNAALTMMLAEGMDPVWERHRRLGETARGVLSGAGMDLFADPAHASNTVTGFLTPDGVSAKAFNARLREQFGVVATGGQGPYADAMVRIGHMGWVTEAETRAAAEAAAAVARSFSTAAV